MTHIQLLRVIFSEYNVKFNHSLQFYNGSSCVKKTQLATTLDIISLYVKNMLYLKQKNMELTTINSS